MIEVKLEVMPWETRNIQIVHDQQLQNLETRFLIS
jgi:hypothetical protein